MTECIFCRIAEGTLSARVVKRTPEAVAFHDLNPQAPVHVLVIPTTHIPSVATAREAEGKAVVAQTVALAAEVARDLGLEADGYRMVTNVGEYGGQSVSHFHIHLLGGRRMTWPPG